MQPSPKNVPLGWCWSGKQCICLTKKLLKKCLCFCAPMYCSSLWSLSCPLLAFTCHSSLFLFVLPFWTLLQPSFSMSTPSQTYHLWHHILLSGCLSMASARPTILPTPSFVSSTKLIYLPTISLIFFTNNPSLRKEGMQRCQPASQTTILPTC